MRLSVVLHGVPNFAEEDAVSDEDEDEPGSLEVGDDAFAWMIGPQNPKEFYSTCWEKKPLHVKRGDPTYYKDLFSSKGKLSVEHCFSWLSLQSMNFVLLVLQFSLAVRYRTFCEVNSKFKSVSEPRTGIECANILGGSVCEDAVRVLKFAQTRYVQLSFFFAESKLICRIQMNTGNSTPGVGRAPQSTLDLPMHYCITTSL